MTATAYKVTLSIKTATSLNIPLFNNTVCVLIG
ncbi:hypothetical protein 101101UKE1_058 [Escherichia phage vB_EcoP-101101UKE1]|uniref:Uncharacterized protein n=1 Tax=Escherichia phage vB_EcoP-101101UKE1 TaxID=2865789 RepID=A0AAE7XSH5_9CAUD|nr:hypothetical protein 101101UKE1_058 [Escherichia phage vB_EcoP-101101UKE1]